jgi:hypothetical protein
MAFEICRVLLDVRIARRQVVALSLLTGPFVKEIHAELR